ncbi:hypothetical protein CHISP_3023 [Chitinispirillum alkaliphilum]|nr:hypothetical protein CHISP_3023 [Chitinispirillum alkaliphilum]
MSNKSIGKKIWAIADGYIPPESHGPQPEMLSHETVSILNSSDEEARVELTVYYSDREPAGPYILTIAPRRVIHQRFNDLDDPEKIPLGTDYACVIRSDIPVVVQHTRLDSRQAENALISTIAFSSSE